MAYELFTDRQTPAVRVQTNGQIHLNAEAYRRLGEPRYAVLLVGTGEDAGTFVIHSTPTRMVGGATITKVGRGGVMTARRFVKRILGGVELPATLPCATNSASGQVIVKGTWQ